MNVWVKFLRDDGTKQSYKGFKELVNEDKAKVITFTSGKNQPKKAVKAPKGITFSKTKASKPKKAVKAPSGITFTSP